MDWMKFNTNERVRVKLSEVGLAAFKRQIEALNMLFPDAPKLPTEPIVDADGYYSDQLWCLMRDFGHLMANGAPPPFDPNILVPVDKLRAVS